MQKENESYLVKKIKYFENNYQHIYKNYEALVFFILSIFFLSGFIALRDNLIGLWNVLFDSNKPWSDVYEFLSNILKSWTLYLILFFFLSSYFITRKITAESENTASNNKQIKNSLEEKIGQLNSTLATKESDISNLRNQLNEAEEAIDELKNNNLNTSFEIGSKFIAHIFTKLELTSRERISLYLKINGYFLLAARYSRDSKFSEAHRKEFSIEQGVIGECWRLNRRILKHLPRNDAPYLKESIKQKFTEAEVKSFTMKSRSLIAQPINRDNFELIGVMVTESTREDWNFDENGDFYDEYHTLCRQFLIHYEKTINACKREIAE